MKKLLYYLVLFFNCGLDNPHELARRTECHIRRTGDPHCVRRIRQGCHRQ